MGDQRESPRARGLRRSLLVFVAVVLGTFTSLAVAWWLALDAQCQYAQTSSSASSASYLMPESEVTVSVDRTSAVECFRVSIVRWIDYSLTFGPAGDWYANRREITRATIVPPDDAGTITNWGLFRSVGGVDEALKGASSGGQIRAGFPVRSVWYSWRFREESVVLDVHYGQWRDRPDGAIEAPPWLIARRQQWQSSWGVLWLPLQIQWPRFAVNIAFWAAAWVVLYQLVGRLWRLLAPVKRRRRRAQGLCPKCAYDLRADFDSGCPECGWNRSDGRGPGAETTRASDRGT